MGLFPLQKTFQRMGNFPLDDSSIFDSLVLLQDYALNNPTAYPGQMCSVVTATTVDVYKINVDLSVSSLASNSTEKRYQAFTPVEEPFEFLITDFTLGRYEVVENDGIQTSNTSVSEENPQLIIYNGATPGTEFLVKNLEQ